MGRRKKLMHQFSNNWFGFNVIGRTEEHRETEMFALQDNCTADDTRLQDEAKKEFKAEAKKKGWFTGLIKFVNF